MAEKTFSRLRNPLTPLGWLNILVQRSGKTPRSAFSQRIIPIKTGEMLMNSRTILNRILDVGIVCFGGLLFFIFLHWYPQLKEVAFGLKFEVPFIFALFLSMSDLFVSYWFALVPLFFGLISIGIRVIQDDSAIATGLRLGITAVLLITSLVAGGAGWLVQKKIDMVTAQQNTSPVNPPQTLPQTGPSK